MFLGISIIGWFLLGLVYVPIAIGMAIWAGKRWQRQRRNIVVVGVVLSIPLVAMVIEAMVVNWRFRALCEEVKLTIKRKVVVEGFFDDGGYGSSGHHGDSFDPRRLDAPPPPAPLSGGYHSDSLNPYDFIEWRDDKGRIWRTERAEAATLTPVPRPGDPSRRIWINDEGKEAALRNLQIDRPSARYHWRHQQFSTPIGHLLARKDEFVIDSHTGEVVGKSGFGYRRPPFADALWLRFFGGPPAMCPDQASLLTEVLIGIHNNRSK